jgi:hypothetical protein
MGTLLWRLRLQKMLELELELELEWRLHPYPNLLSRRKSGARFVPWLPQVHLHLFLPHHLKL